MRNVVVLCLDSVRKDFYDVYAPRLRSRAGVVMSECRAASSWSVPSYASILTGVLPHQHGVHTHDRDYSRLSVADTFFDEMPDHERIGVSSNVFASPAFGFDGLFDRFTSVSEARRYPGGVDPAEFVSSGDPGFVRRQLSLLAESVRHEHPLESLANAALTYLDGLTRRAPVPRLFDGGTKPVLLECRRQLRRASEPFVLFVSMMEAHLPLEPTVGYDGTLYDAPNTFSTDDRGTWELVAPDADHGTYLRRRRGLYGASIDYLDGLVAEFVDSLESETALETSVVVTADHGENLGYPSEGGLVRHKSSLSEGLLHVPCDIINPPAGAAPPGGDYSSHLDFERLVPALGYGELPDVGRDSVAAEVVGMSLGPDPPADHAYWDRMQRALIENSEKYVKDSEGRLVGHHLDPERPCWESDPVEIEAVPGTWSRWFDEPIARYKKRAAEGEADGRVASGVERRLEDLGYR